jgi:hypothetical protein
VLAADFREVPGDPPPPGPPAATRIAIPALSIDLPVVSRASRVPGQGPDRYTPCDVAVSHDDFVQPGRLGTTCIHAHAQQGMFLPLLTASRADARAPLGMWVLVYTSDRLVHEYELTRVKRHAVDWSLVDRLSPTEEHIVLQSSEGGADDPRLQDLAMPVGVGPAPPEETVPKPRPRACYPG